MKGVKTAKRVLNSKDEAAEWMVNNVKDIKNAFIEERPGEDSKCLRLSGANTIVIRRR
jgi:hypothetical protein